MAFDSIEPISDGYRSEISTAILTTLIANIYRTEHSEIFELDEFIPVYTPKPQRSAEDLYAELKAWAKLARRPAQEVTQ